jgi:hypothetical protein
MLVLKEYFYGYRAEPTQQFHSASTAVVSALAGIASDRGAALTPAVWCVKSKSDDMPGRKTAKLSMRTGS